MSAAGARSASGRVGLLPATVMVEPVIARLAPIRINLLPHREAARKRRRKEFVTTAVLVAIAGAVATFAGGVAIDRQIDAQQSRNDFIAAENAKLDAQIAEIRTLRDDIAALRARQQAVENLQSDRTVPVRLFDELVRLVPEGLYLRSLKQDGSRVALVGHARTNERVAELLRNLAERSPWLERPELGQVREILVPAAPGQKEGRVLFEFSVNALVRRPGASEPATAAAVTTGTPAPQASR
jgi:type IV pilus assembly protein PilN